MIHHLQHIVDLVEICRLKGIRQVVISPGSRNAALIKLFASKPYFELHSIVDERSAAFYALGIALETQKPVALLCTSGTAVLNYAPALAEAYYRHVPLVAITTDRPEHLIDQQDNQTIRQKDIYSNYIKVSLHIELPLHSTAELEKQHKAIDSILNKAVSGIKGPVQINVPIVEPFYIELPQASENIVISTPEEEKNILPESLKEAWISASKPMIICGEGVETLNTVLNSLADKAIILAEPISNIKGKKIISAIDRLMMGIENCNDETFYPDLLISFGGAVVSKRLKLWLQKQKDITHFRISEENDGIDTYQNLTETIVGTPSDILKDISILESNSDNTFLRKWYAAYAANTQIHNSISELLYSDIVVFRQIVQCLPNNCILHLGNSNPVRYAQLFDLSRCDSVYSNRGVSGIDGCLSTAAGFASQSDKMNIAILGDLSFLYDSNGLWNSNLPHNLKIIVVNNEGGGIFRVIPGSSDIESFEEFMETRHPVDIGKLASAYGVKYLFSGTLDRLYKQLHQLFESESTTLLEIRTPQLKNAEVYKKYINKIKNL